MLYRFKFCNEDLMLLAALFTAETALFMPDVITLTSRFMVLVILTTTAAPVVLTVESIVFAADDVSSVIVELMLENEAITLEQLAAANDAKSSPSAARIISIAVVTVPAALVMPVVNPVPHEAAL